MGNKITLAVVKYPGRPLTPWKVEIPASIAGTRLRKFFRTKKVAEEFSEEFSAEVRRRGTSAPRDGMKVGLALSRYMETKSLGASVRQKETLKYHEKRIREKLGHMRLESLQIRDIERCVLKPGWAKRTQFNALSYLKTFLNWCQRREYCERNLADRLGEEIKKPEAPKAILSVEEMRLLLGLTRRDPVLRGFVVLGGFAGIRSVEMMRMRWKDVNEEEKEIHVRPEVIKKTRGMRERYTILNATAARWLPSERGVRVIPMTQRVFGRRTENLIARMQRVMRRLEMPGWERWHDWPQNCLRHSYASYQLALKHDAGFVAHQMGHESTRMVHQSYARAVRKIDAERWWAL